MAAASAAERARVPERHACIASVGFSCLRAPLWIVEYGQSLVAPYASFVVLPRLVLLYVAICGFFGAGCSDVHRGGMVRRQTSISEIFLFERSISIVSIIRKMFNETAFSKRKRMIRTKSIYGPAGGEDGLRVLITRFYPRGVRREKYDIWTRSLAPSPTLLRQYKNSEITWDGFKTMLLSELRDNIDSVEAIYALQTKSERENITLLCYERDGCPCHRHIVRDLIEDPRLLDAKLVPKNTDYHETAPM